MKFFNKYENKISNIDKHDLVWLHLVPPFQEWLASTNAANFITTNVNEKRTVDQIEKNPHLQNVLMAYIQLKAE